MTTTANSTPECTSSPAPAAPRETERAEGLPATVQNPRAGEIENALDSVPQEDRAQAEFALKTPDLYPAKSVAAYLKVSIQTVHAWRKERGIKKATS